MLFGKVERHVKRILIVEDEALVAFDNEVMVGNAGYVVVATVDDLDEALAVIERELAPAGEGEEPGARGIDLILTDITLAGTGSGVDLARRVRGRGLPVLFASANPPDDAEELAIGVLIKPYNERRLKAALKAVEQSLAGKSRVRAPDGMILYPRRVSG